MGFDVQWLHPTMVGRNDRLLFECEQRGWTIGASRVTANYAEQKKLYDLYRAGRGNLAADPDAPGVMSPWGWQVKGSFHQIQLDNYSHAIDYTIAGCTWDEFHKVANRHGIGFPLYEQGLGEAWHAQWWDGRGIYIDHVGEQPTHEEDDDVQWKILAPAGAAAKFIAPMSPLPDGTLAALYCIWLPTGDKVEEYAKRGVTELALGVDDLRNVALVGPVPHGDTVDWTAANFLCAS